MSEEPANSGPVVPSAAHAGTRPAGGLRVMRCVRHQEREAAARCPSCGASFCRECVSEHAGRLLCAQCLAKELAASAAPKAAARKRDWAPLLRWLRGAAAVGFAWLCFYLAGSIVVRFPPELHEGKIWSVLK